MFETKKKNYAITWYIYTKILMQGLLGSELNIRQLFAKYTMYGIESYGAGKHYSLKIKRSK